MFDFIFKISFLFIYLFRSIFINNLFCLRTLETSIYCPQTIYSMAKSKLYTFHDDFMRLRATTFFCLSSCCVRVCVNILYIF